MTQPVYLTQEKFDALKQELLHRKTTLRKEISDKIGTAKEQGDLSENFEYQDAKDIQAENESQIYKLEELLHHAEIVSQGEGGSTIQMGTIFVVEMPNGSEKEFQIVGAQETNPMAGKISNESPLGNAFLGAEKGADVSVEMGDSTVIYRVKEIK